MENEEKVRENVEWGLEKDVMPLESCDPTVMSMVIFKVWTPLSMPPTKNNDKHGLFMGFKIFILFLV